MIWQFKIILNFYLFSTYAIFAQRIFGKPLDQLLVRLFVGVDNVLVAILELKKIKIKKNQSPV